MIPGTSCLATIVLSLRDKIQATAEALLKLALMGLKPVGVKLSKASAVECVLSRRDSTIVARHEVPGRPLQAVG